MNSALIWPAHFFEALARPIQPDAMLLERCRAGEREAFDILLHRYRDRVLNLAFQLLRDQAQAEDVAQEVFIRAFSKIHQFRGEGALFTWLYQITLNECRAKTRRPKNFVPLDEVEASAPEVESGALHRLAVDATLEKLSPPLRIALILREMHGLSYEETAAVLELPIGTVRSRLHEARKQFQQHWEGE